MHGMSVRGFRTQVAALAAALLLPAWSAPAQGSEAGILADRLLVAECGDCLVIDPERRQGLAAEIDRVLARVRELRPDLTDIRARAAFDPGALLIEAEPGLLDALVQAPRGRAGHAAFDTLGDRLGLKSVRVFSFADTALLRFAAPVNIAAVARAYREVEGVKSAEPDTVLSDGPDIAAARHGAVWHVVIDRAWGDCPSGCLHRETSFFAVGGDGVSEIEARRALKMPGFEKALLSSGHGRFAQPR